MELIVKTYPEELTEFDFYGYMGKYFAEPKYKKELPYMNHNENRHWRLYFNEKGEFIGFSSYEMKKTCVYITSTYVIKENRDKNYGKSIIDDMISLFPKNILQCVSNNQKLLKILKDKRFDYVSKHGSYHRMMKEVEL